MWTSSRAAPRSRCARSGSTRCASSSRMLTDMAKARRSSVSSSPHEGVRDTLSQIGGEVVNAATLVSGQLVAQAREREVWGSLDSNAGDFALCAVRFGTDTLRLTGRGSAGTSKRSGPRCRSPVRNRAAARLGTSADRIGRGELFARSLGLLAGIGCVDRDDDVLDENHQVERICPGRL